MTTTTQYEVGTIVHVAPADLLIQRNIRSIDSTKDKAFADMVKSVAAIGVKQPIVARLTAEGRLLVRMGERRTLAAIQANSDKTGTVPVYVEAVDGQDDAAEVERIIEQRDENTHRAGLTTAEEISVVEQLTAFGLSPAQIAKKARIKRGAVDTALVVSESELARKASERYADLTLDQAAVVAEFEDDTETVKALITAAISGQFDHVAQRARNDRAQAQARALVVEALEAEGVTVVERLNYDSKANAITSLKATTEATERLTVETHAGCPGHVAWITTRWVDVDQSGNPIVEPDEPADDADESEWDGPTRPSATRSGPRHATCRCPLPSTGATTRPSTATSTRTPPRRPTSPRLPR